MGTMDQATIDHVRHVGLHALHEKDGKYPGTAPFPSQRRPASERGPQAKMHPGFRRLPNSAKRQTAGKVKVGLSAVKAVNVVVGDKSLARVTPESNFRSARWDHANQHCGRSASCGHEPAPRGDL